MFPGFREKKRSTAKYPRLYGPTLILRHPKRLHFRHSLNKNMQTRMHLFFKFNRLLRFNSNLHWINFSLKLLVFVQWTITALKYLQCMEQTKNFLQNRDKNTKLCNNTFIQFNCVKDFLTIVHKSVEIHGLTALCLRLGKQRCYRDLNTKRKNPTFYTIGRWASP